jgi:hypothetical protein
MRVRLASGLRGDMQFVRRVAFVVLLLSLIATEAARADYGMRPGKLSSPADEALARRIVIRAADLAPKHAWRRFSNPWFLDYDCIGAPNERTLVMKGEASSPLVASGIAVTTTAHVLSSADAGQVEWKGWAQRSVFNCFPRLRGAWMVDGMTSRAVARQVLPIDRAKLVARAHAFRVIARITSRRGAQYYWFQDFVEVGDGRINAFLQVLQVRRTRSAAEVVSVSKFTLMLAVELILRIQHELRSG